MSCESTKILQEHKKQHQQQWRKDTPAHKEKHLPFGVPYYSVADARGAHYILPHSSHYTGYIGELGTALWSSFTLSNDTLRPEGEAGEDEESSASWLADPRLPRDTQEQCNEYLEGGHYHTETVTVRQLFPTELEHPEVQAREGHFLTNAIALRRRFVARGRGAVLAALRRWARRGAINVLTGPVWDRDLDGRADTIGHIRSRVDYLTPSHVFFVVTSCDDDDVTLAACPLPLLRALPLLLPNTDRDEGCKMSDEEYLRYHLSSLADVGRLTGLRLLPRFRGDPALPPLLARQPLQLW